LVYDVHCCSHRFPLNPLNTLVRGTKAINQPITVSWPENRPVGRFY
jgi:hypothetical protein